MAEPMSETKPDLLSDLPAQVREALAAIDEHKGLRTVVLDMASVSSFTDFMVLCNGRSEPHVKALADAVRERLIENDVKVAHVEGMREGHWVLLDYGDMVVHVFTPEMRDFYQLERLWRDAPMIEIGDPEEG